MVPTGFVFAAFAAGVTKSNQVSHWAWVLQNDHHQLALTISLTLAVLGLAAFAVSSGQLSIRLPQYPFIGSGNKGEFS
jgi:hypothetical protein